MVFGMLHDYRLSWMSIRWNVSYHCITLIYVQHVEVCKKRLSIYTNDLSFANRGCGLNKRLYIDTETGHRNTTGHRKMNTDRWTQKLKKSLLYHDFHQLHMKMKLKRKGNGHGNPTSPFFVYCHIVWRLQLLDDLHLVGLALHDAKVTKQLWKERSCE